MSEPRRSHDAFEESLRRIRVAEPSADLRRRILDGRRQEARTRTIWWSWTSWRPELALAAAILVALGVLAVLRASGAGGPPAAETAETAETARRLTHTVDQGERTAEYLAARLAMSRRIHELESMRRVRTTSDL